MAYPLKTDVSSLQKKLLAVIARQINHLEKTQFKNKCIVDRTFMSQLKTLADALHDQVKLQLAVEAAAKKQLESLPEEQLEIIANGGKKPATKTQPRPAQARREQPNAPETTEATKEAPHASAESRYEVGSEAAPGGASPDRPADREPAGGADGDHHPAGPVPPGT